MCASEGLADGVGVGIPSVQTFNVALAELPLAQRVFLAVEKTVELGRGADIEPEFEKALINDVKHGTKLIQVLRDLEKRWTDLLSPNTKNSESTCTPEYYESVKIGRAHV